MLLFLSIWIYGSMQCLIFGSLFWFSFEFQICSWSCCICLNCFFSELHSSGLYATSLSILISFECCIRYNRNNSIILNNNSNLWNNFVQQKLINHSTVLNQFCATIAKLQYNMKMQEWCPTTLYLYLPQHCTTSPHL